VHDLGTQARGAALDAVVLPPPPLPDAPFVHEAAIAVPPATPAPATDTGRAASHPVVLVDPRPWTHFAARRLAAHASQIVALSARRLEPALHARGVRAHRLPALESRPERWTARLLELAAKLEPRATVVACSDAALELLRAHRRMLEPHYRFTPALVESLPVDGAGPDRALREALRRGEPALEVHLVRDAHGATLGRCVLAWALGAVPDVVASSVGGDDVVAGSERWLASRGHVGYARLVWSPDRFGRLSLRAHSAVFGATLPLVHEDGVDLAALTLAALTGRPARPQRGRCELVRRVPVAEGEAAEAPLVELRVPFDLVDPLPWLAGFLRSLLRP
jgi:hypothetical protein